MRTAAQLVLLVVAIAIVVHGLFGPQLAATNLATVLTWIHYRGLLIGALLVAGNLFCAACPMILVRDLGPPRSHTIAPLADDGSAEVGGAVALRRGALRLRAVRSLGASAPPPPWLVLGYFGAALLVDLTFSGAAFCKHVCPVGQFNFIASTLSPLEVRVRDRDVCRTLQDRRTASRAAATQPRRAIVVQRGCELALFLPTKVGNLDCTFCLDCVQACPHDNVAIGFRVPGDELADNRRRSAIGRLSRRPDLAALALLFTFGALLNAFAMTAPIYAVERWLAAWLGTHVRSTGAGGPLRRPGSRALPLPSPRPPRQRRASWRLHRASASRSIAVRFAYALVPLGAGIWLAHYGFHFLTGAGTIVPVTQTAAIDATGRALLGEPDWRWLGVRSGAVFPLQLGAMCSARWARSRSCIASPRATSHPRQPRGRTVDPGRHRGLTALALWILAQPMEMRGTGSRRMTAALRRRRRAIAVLVLVHQAARRRTTVRRFRSSRTRSPGAYTISIWTDPDTTDDGSAGRAVLGGAGSSWRCERRLPAGTRRTVVDPAARSRRSAARGTARRR